MVHGPLEHGDGAVRAGQAPLEQRSEAHGNHVDIVQLGRVHESGDDVAEIPAAVTAKDLHRDDGGVGCDACHPDVVAGDNTGHRRPVKHVVRE